MKKNLLLIVCLLLTCPLVTWAASEDHAYYITSELLKTNEQVIPAPTPLSEDELKNQFQEILQNLFATRNKCILNLDAKSLQPFYNLKLKVSLWAYESEEQKIKYFKNWSEKQGITFNGIQSVIKIRKIKEKEPGLFGILFFASTEFSYNYLDTPDVSNRFRLGTSHYINLKQEGDQFIITKEWYTDPFADSLNLNNLKSDEVKAYIASHKAPNYTPDERTQRAIDYAHRYCGVSTDDNYLFKYNKDYKNFNPDGGDCANFASQILHEGGKFKKTGAWNYSDREGTKAWVNAQAFKNYMVHSGRASYIAKGSYGQIYKACYELRPGDFVAYEKKGKIVHISTVTGLDSKGYPLVTCHNTDRLLVPFDLGWSNSTITFHLIDVHY
ncbi:amidase domain-containing protein [Sporanaerobium hydrogeniformans]|uniref:Amidase domain-containing protein n=1 Tax=Sporanaerobium hydrogeniformans TaxID=3072179 RepID=A0AC61D921_9FIRM|nr:amidase domain-containing protein [Sporanaerobium hydrogeniformans]